MTNLFELSSYNYELPKELIAQSPHIPVDRCKLLYYNWGKIEDLIFEDIVDLIDSKTVLFFNNSKVLKARIPIKIWNGKWEIFFLGKSSYNIFRALVKPGKKIKIGSIIECLDYKLKIIWFGSAKWEREIEILDDKDIYKLMEKVWEMPLPPYIKYDSSKDKYYQSIFAKKNWSVAAPTASLHFTEKIISKLKDKWVLFEYVTLHIWLGTFQAVNTEDITDFDIHTEIVEVEKNMRHKISNYKKNWYKILAVWTTACRVLESLWHYDWKNNNVIHNLEEWKNIIRFDTKLYIYPWYKYTTVDHMITNFHLPQSSLLLLVSALIWYENTMKCYEWAIRKNYKFYSFWDAMLIKS